jgi:hypothetical protein
MSQRSEEMLDEDDKFQQDIWGIVAPTPRGSKEIMSYFLPSISLQEERTGWRGWNRCSRDSVPRQTDSKVPGV